MLFRENNFPGVGEFAFHDLLIKIYFRFSWLSIDKKTVWGKGFNIYSLMLRVLYLLSHLQNAYYHLFWGKIRIMIF